MAAPRSSTCRSRQTNRRVLCKLRRRRFDVDAGVRSSVNTSHEYTVHDGPDVLTAIALITVWHACNAHCFIMTNDSLVGAHPSRFLTSDRPDAGRSWKPPQRCPERRLYTTTADRIAADDRPIAYVVGRWRTTGSRRTPLRAITSIEKCDIFKFSENLSTVSGLLRCDIDKRDV